MSNEKYVNCASDSTRRSRVVHCAGEGAGAPSGTALAALHLMGITRINLGLVGAVAVAALAALSFQHQTVSRLREENQSLQQQQTRLNQLAADNERLSNLVAQANSPQSAPEQSNSELLRLRGEVGLLRQQSRDLAKLQEENHQLRAEAAQQAAVLSAQRVLTSADVAAINTCINNLRQIDGAMQQCALEHSLSVTNIVTTEQILPYLRNQEEVLRCPSGGIYTYGSLTNPPTCSIPGHAIPLAQ